MKRLLSFGRLYVAVALLAATVGAGCSKKDDVGKPGTNSGVKEKHEDAPIDRWMFDYMKTHYLWNDAVKQVTPDYSLGYEKFLDDVLMKVAKQNDVNHDDGHWEGGKRSYFYSNVARYKTTKAETRGTREQAEGLGIEMMLYTALGQSGKAPYAFLIAAVTPGSPAGRAGLKRGDLISRVNGAVINDANLNSSWQKMMATESGTVRMTRYDPNTQKDGAEISVTASSYADNPVWFRKTFDLDDGRKVGYICYGSFNYHFDDKLIDAFRVFKNERISELVVDLRYNGGGHVVSSTVLGTLIAGSKHSGEVYARTTYNADRKSETPDVYKLGVAQYNESNSNARHSKIAEALDSSVGLDRIFVLCTGNTASASELLVNGLRGLGVELNLIGLTTNGKNVGMEPQKKVFGDYEYDFSPITFYIANSKGESNYGNGFQPDVEARDYTIYQDKDNNIHGIEWGDVLHDEMLANALLWIGTGSKPDLSGQTASTRGIEGLQPRVLRTVAPVRVQNMVLLSEPQE